MKKLIATLLIGLIGSMGYVVVDKTTDERISSLEAQVESQQEIISSYSKDSWAQENSTYNMEIGDELPCYPNSGATYEAVDGSKYSLDKFNCVLTDKDVNGIPTFTMSIKGHLLENSHDSIYLSIFSNKDFGNSTSKVNIDENGYFEYTCEWNKVCDKCTFVLTEAAFN